MPYTPEDWPPELYALLGIPRFDPGADPDSNTDNDDDLEDGTDDTQQPGPDNNSLQNPVSLLNQSDYEGKFPHKTVEYVRVYILGKKKGTPYIEEFEATTGYHIRTIPASQRYQNPVDVGAGGGFMAIVDRFGQYDLIRITDQFANADPTAAFDTNGLPVSGYNWSGLTDTYSLDLQQAVGNTGLGTFSRGLTITPRGRVLILVDGGYIYWDLGQDAVPVPLPDGFSDIKWGGNPGIYDQRTLDGDYYMVAPIQWNACTAMILMDVNRGTIDHMVPGPDGNIVGCALNGQTATIFTASDGQNCDSIARFQFIPGTYFGCGVSSDKFVLPPSQVSLTQSWTNLDFNGSVDPKFLDAVNRGFELGQPYTTKEQDTSTANQIGRTLPSGSDSVSLSLGRTGSPGTITSSINTGKPINIPAFILPVPNPTQNNIRKIAFLHNMVVEMSALPDPPASADSLKPIYRVLHGNRYDYLSDGGFVYGCTIPPSPTNPNESVQVVNDGLSAIGIAIDRSNEPGKLVTPPDMKIALVDVYNGLLLPGDAIKSMGFQAFGGVFAVVNPVYQDKTGYNGLGTTACTAQFWDEAQAIDGVGRTYSQTQGSSSPNGVSGISYADPDVPTYGTPGVFMPGTNVPAPNADELLLSNQQPPLDWPWSTFLPRIVPPSTIMGNTSNASWSPGSDPFYNYWLPSTVQQKFPATLSNVVNTMFYPKRDPVETPTPSFQQNCDSGFFMLNWAQEMDQTHNSDGSVTTTFKTPDQVTQAAIGPLDPTPYQDVVTDNETDLAGGPAFLQSGPVGGGLPANANLNRAIGFDTNIRSWVAVDINLQYQASGFGPNGVAGWVQPATLENGLGVNVGSALVDQQDVLFTSGYAGICANNYVGAVPPYNDVEYNGATPGYLYDSGDTASDGANGIWEVDVFANGVPINTIATPCTFPEQINQAPSGLQQYLQGVFQIGDALSNDVFTDNPSDIGTSVYMSGTVYFTPERITTITVKARLVNYAYDVYRVGYATVNYTAPAYYGSGGICPSNDPGYAVEPNCGTPCCGNILCTSYIFYGNKLLSSDPTRPLVTNILWEGEMTYTLTNDPYTDAGLSVGTFFGPNMAFNLFGVMSGWNVNLRNGFNGQPPAL